MTKIVTAHASGAESLTNPSSDCPNSPCSPAIAVLLCVHAGADPEHLQDAIESIQGQTYGSQRIYVYCDGPLLPAHEAVLERLNVKLGHDVVIRGDSPIGLPGGLNELIERALNAPDIAFMARMDADDISLPQRFAKQVAFFQDYPDVEVIGTWCIEFNNPNTPSFYKEMPTRHSELTDFMLYRSPFNHPTVMFQRSVLERGFRYDPSLKQMQDYDLWARLVTSGVLIGNVPEFLLMFRINDSFYIRRSGFSRAAREIGMRVRYARSMHKFRFVSYVKYSGLFMLRVAPAWAKKLGYKYFRAV